MMYMEDDDFLTWKAVLSWADDEAPLAALGFTRSFARIETSPETGAQEFATCTSIRWWRTQLGGRREIASAAVGERPVSAACRMSWLSMAPSCLSMEAESDHRHELHRTRFWHRTATIRFASRPRPIRSRTTQQ